MTALAQDGAQWPPANIVAMTERKSHLDTLAIALLLACCLFWGFQQILIKTTVGEVPPLWQAALRFVGATAMLWLWCALRGVKLFDRDGTLPRRTAGRLPVRRRVQLHLPGAARHDGVAPDGVSLHLAVRGGAAAAAAGTVRETAAAAMARAADRIRGRGAGLRRGLQRFQHRPAIARRCLRAGGGHAVGPHNAGDPVQRPVARQRGKDAVLPDRGDRSGGTAGVAGAGRNLVTGLLQPTPGAHWRFRP